MTWLTPWLAGIAAAIAVPTLIILYFLKLRRRNVQVSTTLLWKKAIQDLQANAPFQKLRRNILLILQLIVLAGILLAIGQPQIRGQNIAGQKHVILIDRSGSMSSLDEDDGRGGQHSRLAAAKKRATGLIDSLRDGGVFDKDSADEAMVIAFDSTAEVRQQFTSDKNVLKAAVEAIEQTDAPTRIEEAMRLAIAHKPTRIVEDQGLIGGLPVTMHIYSDGRIPDAAKAMPAREDAVEYTKIGTDNAGNLGIVGLRSERSFENPAKLGIFVALQNNETAARSTDVELLIDGVVAGIKNTTVQAASDEGPALSAPAAAQAGARERGAAEVVGLPPDSIEPAPKRNITPGVGGVVFQLERGEGALVQVRLRGAGTGEALIGDVLPMDDRAWLVVPPAKKMAVAVVSKGNLFLKTALSGLPLSRLTELTSAQFDEMLRQGKLGEYDVIVLDGWLPQGPPASAAAPAPPSTSTPAPLPQGPPLPPGRFLVLGAVPGPASGLMLHAKGGAAAIIDWSRDHPILRALTLESLIIGELPKVEPVPGGPAQTIAVSDSGPAMFEVTTAETRAIVVPFDVANSSWPFDVSFVLFTAASINYLGDDAAYGVVGRMVQPGSVLSDRLPAGAESVEVKTPTGETQKLIPAADGRIVFGPVSKSGVYEVSWTGSSGPSDVRGSGGRIIRPYAANLLDAAESDVAPQGEVSLASTVAQAESGQAIDAAKRLWPWLLLAALAVIMLEWFVYNRKVHV